MDALLKIYYRKTGELKQKLIDQSLLSDDSKFNKINTSIFGGGIVVGSSNNIFLAAPAPFIIYNIKYNGENFVVSNKWDFTDLPFVKNFTQKEFRRELFSKISIIMKLVLVGKNEQHLLVQVLTGNIAYNYIISKSGELIDIYKSNHYTLLGAFDGKVFFRFSNKDRELLVKEYKYKF